MIEILEYVALGLLGLLGLISLAAIALVVALGIQGNSYKGRFLMMGLPWFRQGNK